MSVVSPWGFGINRREIEILLRELVRAITGLADDRVFIDDQGARTPDPPRPFVGIKIGNAVASYPAWGDRRLFPTLEAWSVTVTDAADGTYSVVVLGTSYDFVASSSTVSDIRDGLVTAMGTPTGFTVTASGTDQLILASTVNGQSLQVNATPATLVVLRTKSAWYERRLEKMDLQVDFQIKALISLQDPLPTQNAHHFADLIQLVLNNPTMTQKMRDCGHVPEFDTRIDGPDVLQGQQNSEETVQLILRTTARMDVGIDAILQAPTNPVVVQQ